MYLLTIVIPTKNRQRCAISTIRNAVEASRGMAEIVIHDCSDDNSLLALIRENSLGSALSYYHLGRPVSMTENWNLAMEKVHGEYVMVIGDDDGVDLNIMDIAAWASGHQFMAVKAQRYSLYVHPDYPYPGTAATMKIPPYTGDVTVARMDKILALCLETGDDYQSLPMVYYNLVKKSVLDSIAQVTGRYFGGTAPDIYSAYSIASFLGDSELALVDFPLAIVGSSLGSNTGRQVTRSLDLHIKEYGEYEFSWLAPESHDFNALTCDNMAKALLDLNKEDLVHRINIPRVYARTMCKEPGRILEHYHRYLEVTKRLKRPLVSSLLLLCIMILGKTGINLFRPARPNPLMRVSPCIDFKNVSTIGEAAGLQDRWLKDNRVTISHNDK